MTPNVHDILGRHQLADGLPIELDLDRSHGPWIFDARSGEEYLDFFTSFATWPIGYNHPRMDEPDFREDLHRAAANNPSNSDIYTESMARFVEAFATRVTPEGFPRHFWIAGGALAVENALKAAFDWKAKRVGGGREDWAVLHLQGAFHGRSGYTLSLTNTEPNKIELFPKFDWPRVSAPAIEFDANGGVANDVAAAEKQTEAEIQAAFDRFGDRIAAIIVEPIQCEGGDRHFRREFFEMLRNVADRRDALLIFDEVQTGFFGSGKPWTWQHHGVLPDLVSFGKKTQVCGVYAGPRLDEVEDNVFRVSGRINSTWGGNLVDMVRCRQFIEIIHGEGLQENVARVGATFLEGLREQARDPGTISNPRGVGSMIAFDLESREARDRCLKELFDRKLLALACGPHSVRFRLPFVATETEVGDALQRIADALPACV